MDAELQAFEDARSDRDRRTAGHHEKLAAAYLKKHADDPVFLWCADHNTIPELVGKVDEARLLGNAAVVAKIDVWLECKHEKQFISGIVAPGSN